NRANSPQAVTSRLLKLTENPSPCSTDPAMIITYPNDPQWLSLMVSIEQTSPLRRHQQGS
ncbi:MAG: hypothetical protein KBA32_12300, partial [Propionivibrio sp.]|nr:hypothetical protein [Propionivibrio sp.]